MNIKTTALKLARKKGYSDILDLFPKDQVKEDDKNGDDEEEEEYDE